MMLAICPHLGGSWEAGLTYNMLEMIFPRESFCKYERLKCQNDISQVSLKY